MTTHKHLGLRIAFVAMVLSVSAFGQSVTIDEYPVPTPGAGPGGITAGPDGALWFSEFFANKVVRLATNGTFVEFELPYAVGPGYMKTGPDGALWFQEAAADRIGRITTTGDFSDYPLPTPGVYPNHLTAGPDGAIWFTEYFGNSIGRITTAGVVTEFPLPTAGSLPEGITVGPDGALWVALRGAGQIARLATNGALTVFPLPSGGDPFAITLGPDGALWFTEFSATRIGRLTTSGTFSEYDLPTAGSLPIDITLGSDNALWFAEYGAHQIGRITVAGIISEYPTPTSGSSPTSIASGPDGNIWFTEFSANQVGRVLLTGAITVTTNLQNATYTLRSGRTRFQGSGASSMFPNLPPGRYVIVFHVVRGYAPPPAQVILLSSGQTVAVTGTYDLVGAEASFGSVFPLKARAQAYPLGVGPPTPDGIGRDRPVFAGARGFHRASGLVLIPKQTTINEPRSQRVMWFGEQAESAGCDAVRS